MINPFIIIVLTPFAANGVRLIYEYYTSINQSNNLDFCKKKYNNEIHIKYHEFMGNYHKMLIQGK